MLCGWCNSLDNKPHTPSASPPLGRRSPVSSMSCCMSSTRLLPAGTGTTRGAVPGPRRNTSELAAGGEDSPSACCQAAACCALPS